MKYIVDIDCLKECLGLLNQPVVNRDYVSLTHVIAMIDSFPKEDIGNNVVYKEGVNKK